MFVFSTHLLLALRQKVVFILFLKLWALFLIILFSQLDDGHDIKVPHGLVYIKLSKCCDKFHFILDFYENFVTTVTRWRKFETIILYTDMKTIKI